MMRVVGHVTDDWYEVRRRRGFIVVDYLNLRLFSPRIAKSFKKWVTEKQFDNLISSRDLMYSSDEDR